MIGKTLTEAGELSGLFSELVQGHTVSDSDRLGDASMLGGVAKFPARIKCATLAWKALEKSDRRRYPTIRCGTQTLGNR